MRKVIIPLVINWLFIAFFFISCDIDRFPAGSMASEQVVSNPSETLDYMIDGAYAQLKSWSDPMHRMGEYAGDNMMIRGSSTDAFYEFITFSRTPDNYRLQNFWDYGYKAIAQASNIIQMIGETDDDDIQSKLGECYYIRGMMYFYFCRAFGRPYYQGAETNLGVPIVNGTPEDMDNLELPDRSTVKETYQQAINDLRQAEATITRNDGPAYASKGAAQAMLSRVYLYMSGTYESPNTIYADSARYYAELVINSGDYSLASRSAYMKSNTTTPEDYTEDIFVVKRLASEFSGYDYYYTIGGMYSNIGGMGWGEMYASAKYLDLLNEEGRNDWRPDSENIIDARATFIEPQYEQDDSGNYTEVFRFIIPNSSNTGYVYKQLSVNASHTVCTETQNGEEQTYALVPYTEDGRSADEEYYTIRYGGVDYVGLIDYYISLNNGYPMFYIVKCSREDGQDSQLHSPIISRLDEMYLNRAEAYVKLGRLAEAMADINVIRGRAIEGGEYSTSEFTAETASSLVDKERQLEMAYQAERSYDVFRNGDPLVRRYPGPHSANEDIPATDYRVVYFIPQDAINSYPSGSTLTQNPVSN